MQDGHTVRYRTAGISSGEGGTCWNAPFTRASHLSGEVLGKGDCCTSQLRRRQEAPRRNLPLLRTSTLRPASQHRHTKPQQEKVYLCGRRYLQQQMRQQSGDQRAPSAREGARRGVVADMSGDDEGSPLSIPRGHRRRSTTRTPCLGPAPSLMGVIGRRLCGGPAALGALSLRVG